MKKFVLILCIIMLNIIFFSQSIYSQWFESNNGLTSKQILCLAVSGSNIFAGTTDGGIFLSTDNGSNWTAKNNGLTVLRIQSIAISSSNIFVATDGGGVLVSTNNGESWIPKNTGLPARVMSVSISGTNIFAGTFGNQSGLYLSSDNGDSWMLKKSFSTYAYVKKVITNGSDLFAVSGGVGILLSTDNGDTWTEKNSGLPVYYTNIQTTDLIIDGSNLLTGTQHGMFLSTDYGNSWTEKGSGLTDSVISSLAVIGSFIIAGTKHDGVFVSTNNTDNWTAKNSGLTNMNILRLLVSGNNIYAGTFGGGIFKANISEITDVNKVVNATDIYSYPNPATDFINIHFDYNSIIQPSDIKIYSLYGNEIKLNVKSISESNIEFDVSLLPQGVYFVNVSNGDKVERMKFLRIEN